jgi:hypothetical protein
MREDAGRKFESCLREEVDVGSILYYTMLLPPDPVLYTAATSTSSVYYCRQFRILLGLFCILLPPVPVLYTAGILLVYYCDRCRFIPIVVIYTYTYTNANTNTDEGYHQPIPNHTGIFIHAYLARSTASTVVTALLGRLYPTSVRY